MLLYTLKGLLARLYQHIDRRLRGIPGILILAVNRFNRVRGAEAAASMAFFALFSIFPLLVFITSVAGFVITSQARQQVVSSFIQAFPLSQSLIEENLGQILENRRASGLIGLAMLAWSASGIFITLDRNINRAWPGVNDRNLVQGRLIGLAAVAAVTVLMVAWLVFNTLLNLLARLNLPPLPDLHNSPLWRWTTYLAPWLVAFAIFLSLYLWLPNTTVKVSEAYWGALAASTAWQLMTQLFSWYLASGLAQYEIVYGTLSTIVIVMTWIYLSAFIAIFGAHLSSAIASKTRLRKALLSRRADDSSSGYQEFYE